eukprot:Partr_v1_DN26612_c2_g2_i1_m68859 putative Conserved hypothetical protein
MVQSWNSAGIRGLWDIVMDIRLLRPRMITSNVSSIDYAALRRDHGVRVCIFDKDNCLTAPYADKIHRPFESAIDECRRVFGHDHLYILSNSAGMEGEDVGFAHVRDDCPHSDDHNILTELGEKD